MSSSDARGVRLAALRPTQGRRGRSSRFHWRLDGCTCGLGPGWPGRLEADTCSHTQRPRGCSEAVELPPDGAHPEATGAGRPPGGFLRLSLSAAQADQQRRSGQRLHPPRATHTHRLASLSRVSREPVLAWGPLQKAKEGSFISFRDTHTSRTLCHPRGQKLPFHFQGGNGKVTATSTAGSPGLGTAPSNPYIQPEGHCCFPRGEAEQPRGPAAGGTGPRSLWGRSRAPS